MVRERRGFMGYIGVLAKITGERAQERVDKCLLGWKISRRLLADLLLRERERRENRFDDFVRG